MAISLTSVNGIPLVHDRLTAGAAFNIDRPAEADVQIEFDGGWSLGLVRGKSTCVIRGCDLRDYRPVIDAAITAAIRGLDILSAFDGPAHSVHNGNDEHIVFSPTADGHMTVYWACVARVGFTVRLTGRVIRPDGTEVHVVKSEHPWVYHPSYHYFRRSQVERDLADSYRHAYLALEALLDTIHPQGGLPEGVWLEAALKQACTWASLPQPTNPGESVVDSAKRRWYHEERLQLFHSKPSRMGLRDFTTSSYDELLKKREEILSFYVELARNVLHMRRGNSRFSHAAFEAVLERFSGPEFGIVAMDDSDPPELGTRRGASRELAGAPAGHGTFICRNVSIPRTHRVKRWEFGTPDEPGAYAELDQGALHLDERDVLSVRLRMAMGSGHYRQHFYS